ncbi:MAG: hypothetical protein DI563_05665 [Variovorax paradoxus]|uniref:Thiamine biosynthesis protein ThiF n=1 Tax=Variovorax paradoxus TaxID=34073 RepID=A0A2W5QI00_VARPD|nr:MAG: hypothetical protein DI563_05665 [Variovorax paradoxus]
MAAPRATRVAISGAHHRALERHLFPGDGKEAVAFALCGRARRDDQELILVREIVPVPYDMCPVRTPHRVTWLGAVLDSVLARALDEGMALVKIHSHPTGYPWFSSTDDEADGTLFPCVFGWLGDSQGPMASMIMLPGGQLVGRSVWAGQVGDAIQAVRVAGDEFRYWFAGAAEEVPEHGRRVAQTFGDATYAQLRRLKVGVVGCSGTGSIVVEQLARNGVGELVLVDNDHTEDKNLNRILNSTRFDARAARNKTLVQDRAIEAMGLGTRVRVHPYDLLDLRALRDLSTCDMVFGCMDSVDGRHVLNKLATAYLIPYIDLGVRLDADGKGGIDSIWFAIHTLQPGGSSLKSRHVYDQRDLEAAFVLRDSPQEYERLKREGYIKGVRVDRPAVISVNMAAAAAAMNEFLARLHGFRLQRNAAFAVRRICLTDSEASMDEGDGAPCQEMGKLVGTGDQEPFLGMMRLGG